MTVRAHKAFNATGMITRHKTITTAAERPQLLSRADVATRFGVSPQTITRWANEGLITSVRTLGGQRRYPVQEVERLLGTLFRGSPGRAGAQPERRDNPHGGREIGEP